MAVDRALLVDTLPASQQPAANAWAAAMFSLGSVIGFFYVSLCYLHLPAINVLHI